MFIDREAELAGLEEEFERTSTRASLVVIYGRRRVGKTELIKRFVASKPHLYLLATLQSREEVVARFSTRAADAFGDEATAREPHTTWDALLDYLARELGREGRPFVVAIDEFTYLVQRDPALPSTLQRHWDERLKDLPVMLVLCGSYAGMMEREVLEQRSPLFGRRTRQLLVGDVGPEHLGRFFPRYSKEQLVELHATLGGVPYYLRKFDPSKGVLDNVRSCILDKDQPLFYDGVVLLREELREPGNYLSILSAIAAGKVTQKEIADRTRLEPALVGKYLDVLRGMRLVGRSVPVTEGNPERSRRGVYGISDGYYGFWLRFVYPYMDYVEEGRADELMANVVRPGFNAFVGRAFERLARRALLALNARGALPARFERIGPWWSRGTEIDLVGLSEATGDLLACEVTWSALGRRDADRELDRLREKVAEIPWRRGERREHYCLVARRIDTVPEDGVLTLDAGDVMG